MSWGPHACHPAVSKHRPRCLDVSLKLDPPSLSLQMGHTKVFFRAGVLGFVEDRWARMQSSALRIQVGGGKWRGGWGSQGERGQTGGGGACRARP